MGIKKQLSGHLSNLKAKKLESIPIAPLQETEQIEFQLNHDVVHKLMIIPEFGKIVSGPFCCSNATIVEGDGLKKAVAGEPATFTIKKNPFYIDEEEVSMVTIARPQKSKDENGSILKVKCSDSDSISGVDITEEGQGIYKVTYVANTPGIY